MIKKKQFDTLDHYIRNFPKDRQIILQTMKEIVTKAAPQATEGIVYGIPTLKLNKKNLVHFGMWKKHIGFYPAPSGIKAFEKEILKYKHAKGSVHFLIDKPLPKSLITKITKFRVKEELAKAKKF